MVENWDLKYRPKVFSELVGEAQRDTARKLEYLIDKGPFPRRLLFYGPPGVGKTSSARIIRRCFECDDGPTTRPCGECYNCKHPGSSLAPFEVNGGETRGVKEIKELVRFTRTAGWHANNVVVILDEVDLLTKEAFAVLRRPLEEPDRAVFVLCTNEIKSIPPQIRSRCHSFKFERVGYDECVELAKRVLAAEGFSLSDDEIHACVDESEGQVRDMLNLLELAVAGKAA